MRISVFGIGYVGLVQAAVFADSGHDVMCVDIDADKVAGLEAGRVPIFEPGLEALVRANTQAGRLRFTTDAGAAVSHAAVQMIAVGTPPDEDGAADVSHVRTVARTIARHMARDTLVVVKSTVPVGTCDAVHEELTAGLNARGVRHVARVASNPEFLKEGSAVADCQRPDRIVVGVADEASETVLREIYAPFNRNHDRIVVMDVRSCELTKYAANCMLATRISFMNEMAMVAERMGADIEKVRLGIGSDPRIGYHFLYAGIGYGGSCFPKDVAAMRRSARAVGVEPTVLDAVEERNAAQKRVLVDKVHAVFGDDLAGRCFALWGLAFKANTDDMREASSRVILEALWAAGAHVRAFDPEAATTARALYGDRDDLVLCATKEEALEGADALVIATEWQAFKVPDFAAIRDALATPHLFDGRNLFDPAQVARHGLHYHAVGRPVSEPDAVPTVVPTVVTAAVQAA